MNRYSQIIEKIFVKKYKKGATGVPFEREDIVRIAKELDIQLPKNLTVRGNLIMRNVWIISTVAFVLTGCATIHQFGEMTLPKEEVAILAGPTNIYIHSVDENTSLGQPSFTGPIFGSGFELYLAPGRHVVTLWLAGAISSKPIRLDYFFEKGMRYRLLTEVRKGMFYARIAQDVRDSKSETDNSPDIIRAKKTYETDNPGEKAYYFDEWLALAKNEDSVLRNSRIIKKEDWDKIKGSVFGVSSGCKRANSNNSPDEFTALYFQDKHFKEMIVDNLSTDSNAFDAFMLSNQSNGIQNTRIWQPGYLSIFLQNDHKSSVKEILIPLKKDGFNKMNNQYCFDGKTK